jgi:hypothetical protein
LKDSKFSEVALHVFFMDLVKCQAEEHESFDIAERFVSGIGAGIFGYVDQAAKLLIS